MDEPKKRQTPPPKRLTDGYLKAFQEWLHDPRLSTRKRRKVALDDLTDGAVPTVEEELATADRCPGCGGPMLRRVKGAGTGPFCCSDCAAEHRYRGP